MGLLAEKYAPTHTSHHSIAMIMFACNRTCCLQCAQYLQSAWHTAALHFCKAIPPPA